MSTRFWNQPVVSFLFINIHIIKNCFQTVCHQSDPRSGDPGRYRSPGERESPGSENLQAPASEWSEQQEEETCTHAEKAE